MGDVSYKTGFFLAYQLLDALYNADETASADSAQVFGEWCESNYAAISGQSGLDILYAPLAQLLEARKTGKATTAREYNALREPLVDLISAWMGKMKVTLYLKPDMPSRAALCVNDDVKPVTISNDYSEIPDTDENSIHVTLTLEPEDLDDSAMKIDVNITSQELFARAKFCFPMDSFDYDRLYLSGKLQSLSTNRNDTSILLGGSFYAMVGLKESIMPRPAVNLAVNAQDPFFTFLSMKNALKVCKKIDTIVIAGGYYFWHTDMSDNPSDYYRSVLTRTNYPVLKKLHNYEGDIMPQMKRSRFDPFLENIFDLSRVYEKEHKRTAIRLSILEYFNTEFNVRPVNGMLRYSFREQSDDVNDKAAETRAKAHNRNYNNSHLESNIEDFSDFLAQMEKKSVRVVVLIPPVTKFYAKHSAPELRESLHEMLEPVIKSHALTFVDLFDSPDFDLEDFQDYDHLNDAGAVKLSKLVAGIIN